MKAKSPDVRRWDVAGFAAQGATFEAQTQVQTLARLAGDDAQGDTLVHWRVQGEQRERLGGLPTVRLHLTAQGGVLRTCQRCLEPVLLKLDVDRRLRFVRGEATAARLDAEGDEDVLALEPVFDLLTLVEDELLLALPVIAMHAACDPPMPAADQGDDGRDAKVSVAADSPFAALAALKFNGGEH